MGLICPWFALLMEHEYINRKGYYSIVRQALEDHRVQRMDSDIGCTEKAHGARVFHRLGIYLRGQAQIIFLANDIVSGVTVPTVILGDQCTPFCLSL